MGATVVVGGGIAGIYSALLCAARGERTILIEQAAEIGGLLNSFQNDAGDWFDYGTHFIAGTQLDEIDAVMLPAEARAQWQKFDNEHGANFFSGRLNSGCLFVDASALPAEAYAQGLREFFEITELPTSAENLKEQMQRTFGESFARDIFAAALGKLFGVGLEELVCDSHLRFGMKRIQILTPESTRMLKQLPVFDERLCFHSFSDGAATRPQYYPKEGGAGQWVAALKQQLESAGVEIRCGSSIAYIEHQGRHLSQMVLNDGEAIEVSQLVWTAALPPICKMLGVPLQGGPPKMRATSLVNLTLDQAPLCDDHFFFCYDPDYQAFRVTLYSNLQPEISEQTGRHRVTIEILSDQHPDENGLAEQCLAELVEMGIFPAGVQILFQSVYPVAQGFPVLTKQLENAKQNLMAALNSSFDNLYLLGRNCSNAWFMNDVLRDVHSKLGPVNRP